MCLMVLKARASATAPPPVVRALYDNKLRGGTFQAYVDDMTAIVVWLSPPEQVGVPARLREIVFEYLRQWPPPSGETPPSTLLDEGLPRQDITNLLEDLVTSLQQRSPTADDTHQPPAEGKKTATHGRRAVKPRRRPPRRAAAQGATTPARNKGGTAGESAAPHSGEGSLKTWLAKTMPVSPLSAKKTTSGRSELAKRLRESLLRQKEPKELPQSRQNTTPPAKVCPSVEHHAVFRIMAPTPYDYFIARDYACFRAVGAMSGPAVAATTPGACRCRQKSCC
ncbi:unnamed protein product [Vitrella brassicaformis CCMP3155]|uniref:Uncharacterized protein n=2 Tax=Vitrella brassicaformis TaxID=1169539 RepID=A0A0G4G1E9_VITBC|nr:unnamed protein product [Vitrella brassicaformis CCMP3155]|eukprot:CEM21827.1 unnamed protein product [Vitrella brassicaformis CCMP3155]